jgi:uncharacterized membrane protein
MHPAERLRHRLNTLCLLVPGQFLCLMAVFWLRFLPPLRPYDFHTPPPRPLLLGLAILTSVLPFLLPARFFRPRAFERGRFYQRLGLHAFRYLAPDGDWVTRRVRRLDPTYRLIRSRADVRAHIAGTYANERWHLAFFVAGLFTQAFAITSGQIGWAVLLTLTNVAFNLYPVLHQRYKRARARRACAPGNTRLPGVDEHALSSS